jgi:hypothetical protein
MYAHVNKLLLKKVFYFKITIYHYKSNQTDQHNLISILFYDNSREHISDPWFVIDWLADSQNINTWQLANRTVKQIMWNALITESLLTCTTHPSDKNHVLERRTSAKINEMQD